MAELKKEKVCVVIPAYNEERNIARAAKEARGLGYPVLVADDGSSDKTAQSARAVDGVEVLTLGTNQGKGAALRSAFVWCVDKNFAALILMDADGQHDPAELDVFLQALNKGDFDIVVGNRMGNPEGMPLIRRATNRFLSWVLSGLAGQNIPDSQCGYRALRAAVLKAAPLHTARFEIESEMLLQAARLGFRIGSVPIRSVYEGEKSQIRPLRDTFRFFRFLFSYLFLKKSA